MLRNTKRSHVSVFNTKTDIYFVSFIWRCSPRICFWYITIRNERRGRNTETDFYCGIEWGKRWNAIHMSESVYPLSGRFWEGISVLSLQLATSGSSNYKGALIRSSAFKANNSDDDDVAEESWRVSPETSEKIKAIAVSIRIMTSNSKQEESETTSGACLKLKTVQEKTSFALVTFGASISLLPRCYHSRSNYHPTTVFVPLFLLPSPAPRRSKLLQILTGKMGVKNFK